eukprot:GHVQ01034818.1.p1 GENE.GHVQ01034818.1~~GHVQ01034818.1.p1  ORF type:complete len:231 (+),score=48.71 GHVQ01034818.1:297-989(+)
MAPKKKLSSSGGKKKKGDKDSDGLSVAMTAVEQNRSYELEIQTLERENLLRTETLMKEKQDETALCEYVSQLKLDLEREKKTTFVVTSDITRHYKALQEELISKINSYETTLTEQKEDFDIATRQLREVKTNSENLISSKESHIIQEKSRIDDLTNEFTDMLTKTLDKMREKLSSSILDCGNAHDATPRFVKKLQTYTTESRRYQQAQRAADIGASLNICNTADGTSSAS